MPRTSQSKAQSSSTNSVENETRLAITHHEKSFVLVTVAFQDLWYSVPSSGKDKNAAPIDLLKAFRALRSQAR